MEELGEGAGVRSWVTQEELGVAETGQLRWLEHLFRMSGCLSPSTRLQMMWQKKVKKCQEAFTANTSSHFLTIGYKFQQ